MSILLHGASEIPRKCVPDCLSLLGILEFSYERPNHHQRPMRLTASQKYQWEFCLAKAVHQGRVRLKEYE